MQSTRDSRDGKSCRRGWRLVIPPRRRRDDLHRRKQKLFRVGKRRVLSDLLLWRRRRFRASAERQDDRSAGEQAHVSHSGYPILSRLTKRALMKTAATSSSAKVTAERIS